MSASTGLLADTNLLVYGHDPRYHAKQRQANVVPDRLIGAQRAVLSAQCLAECFTTVARRLPEPLTQSAALEQVEPFARSCRVVEVTPAVVLEGCRGTIQHCLAFVDAPIWAAAKLNQVPYILTEDAPQGRVLEGIRCLNPFAPDFDDQILG